MSLNPSIISASDPWRKQKIECYLPHRDPFLLIDSADFLSIWDKCHTEYFLKKDNSVFAGHFPDNPVYPGVLVVESLAQSAALLLIVSKAQEKPKSCFLCRIEQARFYHPALAEARLENRVVFTKKRPPFYWCEGVSYIGDDKVASATLCAKLL